MLVAKNFNFKRLLQPIYVKFDNNFVIYEKKLSVFAKVSNTKNLFDKWKLIAAGILKKQAIIRACSQRGQEATLSSWPRYLSPPKIGPLAEFVHNVLFFQKFSSNFAQSFQNSITFLQKFTFICPPKFRLKHFSNVYIFLKSSRCIKIFSLFQNFSNDHIFPDNILVYIPPITYKIAFMFFEIFSYIPINSIIEKISCISFKIFLKLYKDCFKVLSIFNKNFFKTINFL